MDDLLKFLESKIKPILDALRQEFAGIRANRPASQLVEDIPVDLSGQLLKIKQLGSISIVPPRGIQITVWDKESAPLVAKAIEESPLKITPAIDGNMVRLTLPELTEERRQEFTRLVKKAVESYRIKLRALRDETNKKINQALEEKTIGKDQKFKLKDKVQEAVDKANEEIEKMLEGKVREISE